MSHKEDFQYKILDRVYFANHKELIEKIKKGSILRNDKIKVENTWEEAGKISEFVKVFEEADKLLKIPDDADFENIFTHFQIAETNYKNLTEKVISDGKVCSIHDGKSAVYICTVCESLFCEECPAADEKHRRFCPFCGGGCVLYMGQKWQFEENKSKAKYTLENESEELAVQDYQFVYTKLRIKDFMTAFIQPFRFPISFSVGGILFSTLIIGQLIGFFQGGWMVFLVLPLAILTMMFKFGIFLKSFENFRTDDYKRQSFIPRVRKFTIWEDFVNAFSMGVQTYIVAFGLFLILVVGVGLYGWQNFVHNVENTEQQMLAAGEKSNSILETHNVNGDGMRLEEGKLKKMVESRSIQQLKSVFGSNQMTDNEQFEKFIKAVSRISMAFQMPVVFSFFLGILFFPAVCLTIAENRFLSIKQRFLYGFKEIKTIGFDYIKILLMSLISFLSTISAVYGAYYLFDYLKYEVVGIFASIITGSFMFFYFWVAFVSILGITNSSKEIVSEATDDQEEE